MITVVYMEESINNDYVFILCLLKKYLFTKVIRGQPANGEIDRKLRIAEENRLVGSI
jgi:hypothetical protein